FVAAGVCRRVLSVAGGGGGAARVAEARPGLRAVRARLALQRLEVADDPHVVELVVLPQRKTGRVVAAGLEALEPLQQEVLTGSLADVADDPAHAENLP